MTDVRDALRSFARQPWSTLALVGTLSIGVGASTAVYAVCNYAVFRPVPGVPASERLVRVAVEATAPADFPGLQAGTPPPTFSLNATLAHVVAARDSPAFEGIAGNTATELAVLVRDDAAAEHLGVAYVTRDFFSLLRITPAAGRFFARDEYEQPVPLAVISEGLWRKWLGADPAAIGRTIRIAGKPFTLIGVASHFQGLTRIGRQDVWVPSGTGTLLEGRALSGAGAVIARLAAGVSERDATAQLTTAFARVGPIQMRGLTGTPRLKPGLIDAGTKDTTLIGTLWFGAGAAGLLLLLACANAAALLLSRNQRRARDLALRAALGASRARLLRALFVELIGISAMAAAGGLAIAGLLRALVSGFQLNGSIPLAGVVFDWRVAGGAIALAALTVLLAGAGPSILASRTDPQERLREGTRTAARGGRARQGLVAVQQAVSLALVACAAVLAQSMARLHAVDLGFDPSHLVTASQIRPSWSGRDDAASVQFHAELQRRLAETPGIEAASYAKGSLFSGQDGARVAASSDAPLSEPIVVREISADYFRAMGIPIRAGRAFTQDESRGHVLSGRVIIDESVARQLFGAEIPVGRRLSLSPFWMLPGSRVALEIVGVAGAAVASDPRQGVQAAVYLPVGDAQSAAHQVRSSLATTQVVAIIRRLAHDLDPLIPLDAIDTTAGEIDRLAAEDVLLTRVSSVFALLALVLALAGCYAVAAGLVLERTREFGIRMALGAAPAALGRSVLRRTTVTTTVAAIAGLGLYAAAFRTIESRLFGVPRLDVRTMSLASALLFATALVAAWLPAVRATRVDPTTALRRE